MRVLVSVSVSVAALAVPAVAAGYSWPVKPFHRPHPIRGAFGDPRYHLGAESAISSFHFGIDIAAPDDTPVYSVEPGRAQVWSDHVKISRPSGRSYEYWHIHPAVRSGRVHMHQLLGRVIRGWGHVHFAESYRGAYRNPLRRGALTPFYDHTRPTVDAVALLPSYGGGPVNLEHVTGIVDLIASAYDTPPLPPPPPWQLARLAPALIWYVLSGPDLQEESSVVANFGIGLPANVLYPVIYAPGTYQNKANRPGNYLFWLARWFDTTTLADGTYQLLVFAEDTRGNIGTRTLTFRTANGRTTAPPAPHQPELANPAEPE